MASGRVTHSLIGTPGRMFVALLAVSFITSSSLAQPACDVANETLYSNSACSAALEVVFAGAEAGANSSTNATAVATVCGSSTTCSQNISAYIESCPVSIASDTA